MKTSFGVDLNGLSLIAGRAIELTEAKLFDHGLKSAMVPRTVRRMSLRVKAAPGGLGARERVHDVRGRGTGQETLPRPGLNHLLADARQHDVGRVCVGDRPDH